MAPDTVPDPVEFLVLPAERRVVILQLARHEGSVRVTDLVSRLGVSDVTVRRDLDVLADQGMLTKVHGGAVLTDPVPPAAGEPAVREPAAAGGATIGILVPRSSYYFRHVLDGVQGVLSPSGGRILVAVSDYGSVDEEDLVAGLIESGAQGLLLAPTLDGPGIPWTSRLPVPVVLIERRMTGPQASTVSWIRTTHESGAAVAVQHLHELGHRRIALFARDDTPSSRSVRNGWTEAIARLDLPTDLPCVTGAQIPGWPKWRPQEVKRFFRQLRDADVTALLCHNDEDALVLLQQRQAAGVAVPEELSVIAYDDELAAFTDPPLTAVSPPKEQLGALAARTLLEIMAEPDSSVVRHIDLEPTFVTRASTAPATAAKQR